MISKDHKHAGTVAAAGVTLLVQLTNFVLQTAGYEAQIGVVAANALLILAVFAFNRYETTAPLTNEPE